MHSKVLPGFKWKRCNCKKRCGGVGVLFFFCSGQDNFGSNHLMKPLLSSEELPEVLEIGRDVSFFQPCISRPQI